MSNFSGPKAKKNADRVLESLLLGQGPNAWEDSNYGNPEYPLTHKEQIRLEKADKAWDKILKKLGISKYDDTKDTAKVFRYVSGLGIGSDDNNNNSNGGNSDPTRDTGEYDDILGAQAEDQAAGQSMAEQLAELQAQVGGISPEVQAQLDSLTLANTNLSEQLSASATQYQQQLDAAAAQNAEAMQRMEMMMLQQQQQAASTQQLLQSQLASTQSALQSQQRMSANLSKAYVPAAEQSAQSASYGDQRTTTRRKESNSLNDLSIVTGVGSSNSLSGLTLA